MIGVPTAAAICAVLVFTDTTSGDLLISAINFSRENIPAVLNAFSPIPFWINSIDGCSAEFPVRIIW